MGLINQLTERLAGRGSNRGAMTLDELIGQFRYLANQYTYSVGASQTLTGRTEEIESSFYGYVTQAYKANGVVFACMLTRMMLFSEARFMFREMQGGRPGDLFGGSDGRNPANRELDLLAHPWQNATTGDLLSRAIQDVDLAGNFYAARRPGRIKRMQPDWVTIVMGSDRDPVVDMRDLDAEVVGYVYHPGGRSSGIPPVGLFPDQVAHFAPIPDPLAAYRGMSWITPIVREIMGDSAATDHKLRFFDNGATPNMVVKLDKSIVGQAFDDLVERFRKKEPKGGEVYKTMYLGGGAEIEVVGRDLQQLDFKVTQGAGETRIAAASGVHPVVVGLSEGLQGSSLNAGNFQSAMRLTADRTMRPMWRNIAGSLSTIIAVPTGAELWYDDRDVPFLKEDVKDAAEVMKSDAGTIKSLIDAGWEPDKVVDAVVSGDLKRLIGHHSGLYSVQLQPPRAEAPTTDPQLAPPAPNPSSNGKTPAVVEGQ